MHMRMRKHTWRLTVHCVQIKLLYCRGLRAMSTLFSYFNKVRQPIDTNETTPKSRDATKKKRRRMVIESDDSDEESQIMNSEHVNTSFSEHVESVEAKAEHVTTPMDVTLVNTPMDVTLVNTPSRVKSNSTVSGQTPKMRKLDNEGIFPHDKLKWLQKNHLKDKKGRGISHCDYDPRSLQVPQDYYKKLTPGFQQWWTIKSENFDTIIMFKVGKFYELYHMDAVTGVQELGLAFMKSEFAHCGFPETGFGRYSDTLIQKGYKVARVEQVETPVMLEQRIKKSKAATKSDRVVRRELCSVITKGTRTLSFFNDDSSDGESVFLFAIKELPINEGIYDKEYGVCFVDTCVGTFHLGQFKDDGESSKLRTLFAHYPPAHVVCERRGLLPHTNHIIELVLPTSIKDFLVPELEFWTASVTLKRLAEGGYFEGEAGDIKWPPALQTMIENGLGCVACDGYELAVSALGACIWTLKRAHIDYSILSLASFKKCDPLDVECNADGTALSGQRMILDDITLANLDIVSPGNQASTLLDKLDATVTAFGKRLLRQWVCSPLTNISAIEARQDAVEELLKNPVLMAQAKDVLSKLPDIERLLRKIHSQGCHSRAKDHPDSRAIFFERVIYNKRKIADFISIIDALRTSMKILDLSLQSLNSTLLHKLLTIGEDGEFPDLENQLSFYENSFDRAKARSEGVIIPHKGVNREYDSSQQAVNDILKELDQYLNEQRQKLGCKAVVYWGTGRNRFQLEVPMSALTSHKMDEYELTSQKKGFRRYRTPAIDAILKRLTAAEDNRDKSLRDTMENLFSSFDQHFVLWEKAVQCLATLDVLLSIATYSLSASDRMCRPVFVKTNAAPLLEVVDGQHPLILHTHDGAEFIPNDISIEGEASCVLVTGPNMGGKSTLMRQTGLLVVLAQLGCYVPSAGCKLSPVDRIFTRMGASDRIMARESTFFVELKETCSILRHATCHSLVLVDELGRGTATYDGAAIASAVVQQLAEVIKCRALFSTHYHFLVDQFVGNSRVLLRHMACAVEGDEERITFLYKLTKGACPKSYGFNVAQLAGLPSSVISLARKKATSCEREAQHIKLLRKLMQTNIDVADFRI